MIKRGLIYFFVFFTFMSCFLVSSIYSDMNEKLSLEDRTYLNQIARDTWSFLAWNVSEKTGLPYDGYPRHNKFTSVTNIGFYLASLAAACELEFLDRETALHLARQALTSLGRLKTRSGFRQSWNHPDILSPSNDDLWISTLDSGNLAAGLIVLEELIPQVKGECEALLSEMKWSNLYDEKAGFLFGGMKLINGEINNKWHLEMIGTDARLAYVIAIGSGHIPATAWDGLFRDTEERYSQSYFTPGWQGGGIFMQYISGLFLDERKTILGKSAAQFAYAQLLHQKMIDSPVWGWSASVDPDGGYLGWGKITDDVITPHASVLCLPYYPTEVINNLEVFDSLGLRDPVQLSNGELILFGYADAFNWKTERISMERLMLDQAMLFLTIANVIGDGIIWKAFSRHEWIKNAYEKISDLRVSDIELEYSVPGYKGMRVDFDTDEITVRLLNDSDKSIRKSVLVCSMYDRSDKKKSKNSIFVERKKIKINSKECKDLTIAIPPRIHDQYSSVFVEIEWFDASKKRIEKTGKLLSF